MAGAIAPTAAASTVTVLASRLCYSSLASSAAAHRVAAAALRCPISSALLLPGRLRRGAAVRMGHSAAAARAALGLTKPNAVEAPQVRFLARSSRWCFVGVYVVV